MLRNLAVSAAFVANSIGLIDSNSTVEIRDIFSRNKTEIFEANAFDEKALKTAFNNLIQYVSSQIEQLCEFKRTSTSAFIDYALFSVRNIVKT